MKQQPLQMVAVSSWFIRGLWSGCAFFVRCGKLFFSDLSWWSCEGQKAA